MPNKADSAMSTPHLEQQRKVGDVEPFACPVVVKIQHGDSGQHHPVRLRPLVVYPLATGDPDGRAGSGPGG